MMKVSILKSEEERLEFLLEEASPAFANALRRIMVSEVPTMAVESVEFHENSSALYDEIIAHRLAMMPLRFDPDKMNFADKCKCDGEGCPLCQAVFVVDKTGPCTVYSGDMKPASSDVKPTDAKFPIVELLKNQRLKFEAIARVGIGRQHAKWQAANASYQYYPEIVVKSEDFRKYLHSVPKSAIEINEKKVTITDYSKIDTVKKAAEESEGSFEVKEDPARFVFRVESISGLTPEYITITAARLLTEKAEEFKKQAAKI
jgi:DNA-directed RNA polymerase subunit D